MANGDRMSLFGMPSPADYMQDIGRIDPTDVAMANAGINAPAAVGLATRHLAKPVAGMLQQGFNFGPEAVRLAKLKNIFAQAGSPDGNELGYYQNLAKGFQKEGMYDQAFAALSKARGIAESNAALQIDSVKASAAMKKANTDEADMLLKLRETGEDKQELTRLQSIRRNLQEQLSNKPGNAILTRDLADINGRINKLVEVTGRTAQDLSGNKLADMQVEVDNIDIFHNELEDMRNIIKQDPSIAGIVGTGRRLLQTTFGMASDVDTFFEGQGKKIADTMIKGSRDLADSDYLKGEVDPKVTSWLNSNLHDTKLSKIKLFENSAAYRLARSRKPNEKLNTDDIKRASADVKVGGLTSSMDVYDRLGWLQKEIARAKIKAEARMKGSSLRDLREEEAKLNALNSNTTASTSPPVSALKEGIETKFRNGQTWTLINGQPKQVN